MIFSALNSPPLVAATGAGIVLGLPAIEMLFSSSSLPLLKFANTASFIVNATAVSVPGRIDEQQDQAMRQGNLDPKKPTGQETEAMSQPNPTDASPLVPDGATATTPYSVARTRSLVNPSGWAFAIWGPIYAGESIFVLGQLLTNEGGAMASILPQVTAPFLAANVMQSLWCASFRPSYSEGWRKYVSCLMLGGTAYSLSLVHAVGCSAEAASLSWYFLPMTLHFGWTTAATLVNLNGSVAMMEETSDSTVIALGHASAVTAAAIGVGVTLLKSAPIYGVTLAWALAACGDSMKKRLASGQLEEGSSLKSGANAQKYLCWAGSLACVASSIFVSVA